MDSASAASSTPLAAAPFAETDATARLEARPKRRPLEALLAVIVIAAATTYATSTVPSVLGGDSGEFAALFAAGGIAHPPGYPTFVLWLRALHFLPCESPAQGAALATALAAALAVWALQRACLAWGASAAAAAIVSAVFAFSPRAWTLGSEAEVFSLEASFAGVLLMLSAPRAESARAREEARRVSTLGIVAGLALGAHQTIVWLAPVGILAAYRAARASSRPRRAASVGVVALVVGIALPYSYAYFLCRTADPRTVPMWIEAPTLEGLWFHVRRGAYGTFSLASADVAVAMHPLASLLRFTTSVCRDLLGLPVLVVGAALVSARHLPPRTRLPVGMLALSTLLAGPVFAAASNLPLGGVGATVAARFDLLPELMISLLAALSIDVVVPSLARRGGVAVATSTLAMATGVALGGPKVARAHRPDVEQWKNNVLSTVPEGSVVVTDGDAEWGAFLYARYAERRRLDVGVVDPGLVRQAWYRRDLRSQIDVSFDTPDGKPIGPKTLLARLVSTGRPVFYADWPKVTLAETPHDSYGPLMRVWPADSARPDLDALLAANRALFAAYAITLPTVADDGSWGHTLFAEYGRAWGELATRLGKADRPDDAAACFARVETLAPWSLRARPSPP